MASGFPENPPETGTAPSAPERIIVVDDRERKSGVMAVLQAFPDLTIRIERLPVGDYRIDDRALIERKTVADFAQSLMDGRLFRQAQRLMCQPLPAVLLLEGRASDLKDIGVRREALQGALVTLTLLFRMPILRSIDAAETATLIEYASQQLDRETQGLPYSRGRRPRGRRRQQLRLLQGLPGIGPDRAVRLLEHFVSVEKVVGATTEELEAVEGIGPKTAQAIRQLLSEKPPAYGTCR
jgi:DNA excision repair protein ERCC-4